jgi:hypothetical protein
MSAQEALAWEAQHRQRAGYAALAAAVLTIAGSVITTIALPGASQFDDRILTVVDAMSRAAQGLPIPPGRVATYAIDVGRHPAAPIAGAVLYGLGTLLLFFPIAYLFRAARARRPQLPQVALVVSAIGAVGYGVGRTVAEVARYVGAAGFVDAADHSNSAASDALSPSIGVVGQVIWQAGALALGFGFVMIALNAMRVGLLTRFMGILGAIVGATFVLPLDQQGIIRVFWMAAIGALILGRWPSGLPKAWSTGEAEPWPTQQQLREARTAARAGSEQQPTATEDRQVRTPPPAPPAPRRPDVAAAPHSASKKKKRKRRA